MTPKAKKIQIKEEYLPVLYKLQEIGHPIEARELSKILNIEYEKLMSNAVYGLSQVGLAEFNEEEIVQLKITEEGKEYLKKGLPERQIYNVFTKDGRKEVYLEDFQKEVEKTLGFNKKLFFIGISWMKKFKWVVSSKAMGKDQIFVYTENPEPSPMERFLELFKDKDVITTNDVPKDLKNIINQMIKRKLIVKERTTQRIIKLTEKGKKITKEEIDVIKEEVLHITPEMIKTGTWKTHISNLKSYDVGTLGPRIQVGKLHPMTILINEIREIFHSMGFTEIKGPIVETAFYNFDALYQPQDHPAREMHDTFYLSNPASGKLPEKQYIEAVKATHENGGDSGSIGWRYDWSEKIAKKSLLRTHTTATTLRRLSTVIREGTKLPLKVFCIDRVFRNEKVDKTHLAEFQQIEGIVIGENVTLCDLIGQIKEFYKRMGFKKVVTRPGFFPYTEPSMEIAVYSEELGRWLEMGGSGIFRPEVTYPWGIKNPIRVLAWGMGLERLAMLKFKRKDIRDLYQSPISWLREVPY